MQLDKPELLNLLMAETNANLRQAETWLSYSEKELNFKSQPDTWSALECLEHLNRYGSFYIPEIKRCLAAASKVDETRFYSGLLGNYFANMMKPRPKLNKMKTFKSMNPAGSRLDKNVLNEFIQQQKEMRALLNRSAEVSWTKNKTAISISRWIKLRLGDTFRVVIHHNSRHILQAKRQLVISESAVTTH